MMLGFLSSDARMEKIQRGGRPRFDARANRTRAGVDRLSALLRAAVAWRLAVAQLEIRVEAEAHSCSRRLTESDGIRLGGNAGTALIRRRASRSLFALVRSFWVGFYWVGTSFCDCRRCRRVLRAAPFSASACCSMLCAARRSPRELARATSSGSYTVPSRHIAQSTPASRRATATTATRLLRLSATAQPQR